MPNPDSSQHHASAGHDEGAAMPSGVGQPDGLERLWTPHRMSYVAGGDGGAGADSADGDAGADSDGVTKAVASEVLSTSSCPFCRIPTLSDVEGLVVARGALVYCVLNLYPYNAGHLMVVPFRHVADYADATSGEVAEIADMTQHVLRTFRKVSSPHGFNIGLNIGDAGGAGIAAHLHQHIVPRWRGDANFMPVIAKTKVLPQLLSETREMLAAGW